MKLFGKEFKFNNYNVYHTGNKPTPSEIGAASINDSSTASSSAWSSSKTQTELNTRYNTLLKNIENVENNMATYNHTHTPASIGAAAASHGYHVPTVCDSISDWNAATRNGWFMGHNAANAPLSDKWYMGFVIVHNGNYLIQQVYEFTTGGTEIHNVPVYQRVRYNGTWGGWKSSQTVAGAPGSYWNKNVVIGGDGVVEVGKYMDWHFTNNSTADYDVRWQMTDAGTIESTGVLGAPAMKIGGNRVHVSSGTPSSPPVGTVWIQI